jgi:hypothetical protein
MPSIADEHVILDTVEDPKKALARTVGRPLGSLREKGTLDG